MKKGKIPLKLRFIIIPFIVLAGVLLRSVIPTYAMDFKIEKLEQKYVPGEVLVKFKAGVSETAKNSLLLRMGSKYLETLGRTGVVRVKLKEGQTVPEAIKAYKADPDVENVQPNYVYRAMDAPNDPEYDLLWGLNNTGQYIIDPSYSTNNPPGESGMGKDIDAELAWGHIIDCSAVTVAVVDTGVHYNHSDFFGNIWINSGEIEDNGVDDDGNGHVDDISGWDFYDTDNDPMDLNGHGTHVAGIIGAAGNNGFGTTGVCQQVPIMAIRVLGPDGFGTTLTIAQGVDYAVGNGAKVINLSLGGSSYDFTLRNAIENAALNDVVVVVAAGNDNSDNDVSPLYPCSYTLDNIVCVAALDQTYELADFSNYGSSSVDVGAPGVNIISTWSGLSLSDDFVSDWNMSGGWTVDNSCITSGGDPINALVNPNDFCSGGNYAVDADDVAYKEFTLTGDEDYISATYYVYWDLATNDVLGALYSPLPGSPESGTVLGGSYLSGSSGGSFEYYFYELLDCVGYNNCSIGYHLLANGNPITADGAAIALFSMEAIDFEASDHLNTINGTSMATPYVAGVAAMVWSFNPDYNYTDIVNSIKTGGEDVVALNGITTTAKAANAMGSLAHISPPEGVAASVN